MAEVHRNFRSTYLEKVGIKGIEEKKTLDIILNDKNVDLLKLKQFCQKFPLPAAYRLYVWKIVLGVLPSHLEICDYVKQQRQEQYDDLKQTLITMHRVSEDTASPLLHLRMFLIEQGRLPLKENNMLDVTNNKVFLSLSAAIGQLEDDDVDCYWITKKLFLLQNQVKHILPYMVEQLECYLKKEDPQLYNHLVNTCSLNAMPTTHWFMSCFAGTLPESAFEGICDRVIGGACLLLVFVGVSLLIALRNRLLSKNNTEDIMKYLEKLPEESGDIIVMKALEIWQKHGCPLAPAMCRSESPIQAVIGHT